MFRAAVAEVADYSEQAVRAGMMELFERLGFDRANPLRKVVRPGDTVFIKPNWVVHQYRRSCKRQDTVYATITHGTVVQVVADFTAEALGGKGEIRIGDNPSIDADFDKLMELTGLKSLETRYDVPCAVMDLRPLVCVDLKDYGRKDRMVSRPGDLLGATSVNLGESSLFRNMKPKLFRGVFDDRKDTVASHSGGAHLYSLSNSIIRSDVYISIPKLKTHHKCGTTLNLKGLVGAVADKNQLVHWRIGWPGIGGDAYPSFSAWVGGLAAKVKKRGAWKGNDSIWRMVVDLYNAFGRVGPRRRFSVVDGIIAGERDGPFCPTAKNAGVLIGSEDLLTADFAASRLMGFDVARIPYLRYFVETGQVNLDEIGVSANSVDQRAFFNSASRYLAFEPPSGWQDMLVGTMP